MLSACRTPRASKLASKASELAFTPQGATKLRSAREYRTVLLSCRPLDDQVEAMKITNPNKAMGAGWALIAYNDRQNTDNDYRRSLP
jgi:hypothetical protein